MYKQKKEEKKKTPIMLTTTVKSLYVGESLQLQVCLEEVEEEGLLVSWMFSQQPLLFLTLTPRQRVQREVRERLPEPHNSL